MIVAIVLSAGESSRMGRPKALLPIEGTTFIERIISVLRETKTGKIVVVLGHNAEEIRQRIGKLPISIVFNKDYPKGQLSSLTAGIKCLEEEKLLKEVDAALVHLVDHPFLSSTLVNHMIERSYESRMRLFP